MSAAEEDLSGAPEPRADIALANLAVGRQASERARCIRFVGVLALVQAAWMTIVAALVIGLAHTVW